METTLTLSSDSEDDDVTPPPAKRRSIEGVPKSFDGDKKARFSFGVSSRISEDVADSDDVEFRSTSLLKTPVSLRRRSISMSCMTPRDPSKRINEPPANQICSGFVRNEDDDDVAMREEEERDAEKETDLNLRALLSPEKKKRKEKITEVQNEFYGVYCLISRSDRPCYKNRCYIGYTVDPNRRIMQHNGGRFKGGAKKTDSRGPWDMVCVVHGFPNHVAALRFEWAWQNPTVSKTLKEKNLKKERKETPFAYQLRIACQLMNSDTFCRFALTFRWLITKEELPFPTSCPPPEHIKLKYGKVKKEMSLVPAKREDYVEMGECRLCGNDIEKVWSLVRCISDTCHSHFHSKCLAAHGLKRKNEYTEHIFPLKATCPTCGHFFLWGDVIREQRRIIKISTKCAEEFRNLVVRKDLQLIN
ncbi:CRE-SLX-1 protein [Caenorhabditis remanei]|uniref:CRE-SLX-1 protein n=1 Tax=Caenorhabditis remanei TaxID=31234 RepID=E3NFF2_CAERE|nr:CRE-SLX-1 protein [Caenorhabditis remanei]